MNTKEILEDLILNALKTAPEYTYRKVFETRRLFNNKSFLKIQYAITRVFSREDGHTSPSEFATISIGQFHNYEEKWSIILKHMNQKDRESFNLDIGSPTFLEDFHNVLNSLKEIHIKHLGSGKKKYTKNRLKWS